MTKSSSEIIRQAQATAGAILSRRNQPTSEHAQATIAGGLFAVADALKDVADAIREGRSE